MKRIFRFVIMAVALVAVACAEDPTTDLFAEGGVVENEEFTGETVRLGIEVTRASLDGLDLSFEPGDAVQINGKEIHVQGDKHSQFLIVPKAEDNIYRAVFPAPAATAFADSGNGAYVHSNMQVYKPGSFGSEAMCLVAYADLGADAGEGSLRFEAMLGVLKLTVKGDAEVRSIRLQNNAFDPTNSLTAMAGRTKFAKEDGTLLGANVIEGAYKAVPVGASGMTEDIVLICNDTTGKGVQLTAEGTDFYFTVYPQKYAQGFTVTISDNNGKSQKFSTSGETNVPVNTLVEMQPMTYAPDADLLFSEPFDVCVYGGDVVAYRNGSSVWRARTPILQASTLISGMPILKSNTDQNGLQPGYYLTNNTTAKGADKQTMKAVVTPGLVFGDYVSEGENNSATMSAFIDADKLNVTPELLNVRGFNDWYMSRCIEFHGYISVGNEHALNSTSYKFSMNPLGMLMTPHLTAIKGSMDVEVTFDIAAGDGVTGFCKKDTPSTSTSFYTYQPDATEEDEANNIYWREDKFRFSIVGDNTLSSILKLEFIDEEGNVLVNEDGTLMSYESLGKYVEVPESHLPKTWARVKVLVKNANAQTRFRFYNNQATRYMVYHIDNVEVRKADLSYIREDANVTGTVTCDGQPMQGVVVSDGEHVTKTDAEGRYYLQADLETASHVFITIPSGYEMTGKKNKIAPAFFTALTNTSSVQICDFQLKKVDQSNYTILVMADSHVLKGAASFGHTDDRTIFMEQFLPKWKSYANACLAKGPTYGIHLGDMTQRGYWEKKKTILGYTITVNNYPLSSYCSDLSTSPVPIFSALGNHDHDIPSSGATFAENEQHLARKSFTTNVGPAYYSFELGSEHYIVLDNTIIINSDSGSNNYSDTKAEGYKVKIDDKQLQWLKDDVAQIDPTKIKGVVICTHCQFYYANKGYATIGSKEVMNALSKFPVTILVGHSHIDRYIETTTPTYGKSVREYIHIALMGTAWLDLIATDGSPASFAAYTFADGKTASRKIVPFGKNEGLTYRAYDKNVSTQYAVTEGSYSAKKADGDDTAKTAPAVIVNAWGVKTVSFTESTGGTGTVVTTPLYDPTYRDWFYTSLASSDRNSILCNTTYPDGPSWQHPYNGGTHIWKYIPANPNAVITATLTDEFGGTRTLTLQAK